MGCGASNQKLAVAEPQSVGNKKLQQRNESQIQQNKKNKLSEEIVIQDLDVEGDIRTEYKASPNKATTQPQHPVEDPNARSKNHKLTENQYNELIQLKRYKKGELIDKGAYGKVYKGLDTLTNEIVAIKYIEISGTYEEVKKEINSLKKEIILLKKLNHPNIVKYYDFDITDDKSGVDIILEYVPNGSLRMALNKQKCFDETKTAIYTRQILEGLEYLHKNNIIHRDLKGANLLLDAEGRAKLTDFGTAKQIESDLRKSQVGEEDIAKMNKSLKGTPNWMAPEVIERIGHTSSADIWSIGCIVIEMLTGKPPYPGLSAKEVFLKIASGVLPDFPKGVSYECQEFLEACLQIEPKKRLTASQLLKTPFILRKKIRRQQSYNSLMSQEELLEQISSIQQGQNIQQEYSKINRGSQRSITGPANGQLKTPPLVISNNTNNGASSSQPIIMNKQNPYSDYQYGGNSQQKQYQEYQDSQIDQLKERTRSLNHFSNNQKIGTQPNRQQSRQQSSGKESSNKNINAEDDILAIAKQVKRQQEYVQANINPGYDQYQYNKPKTENHLIKFTTKELDTNQALNNNNNNHNNNNYDPTLNQFSRNNSRQGTYSQQKAPIPFKSSLVDIKDDEEEEDMNTTEMVRRSQKSLTLLKSKHKNLLDDHVSSSSQPKIGSANNYKDNFGGGYHQNNSNYNHNYSPEDDEQELPQESREVPFSRHNTNQFSKEKSATQLNQIYVNTESEQVDTEEKNDTDQIDNTLQENEYLKLENKVISTKAAMVQRIQLNKQLAAQQQRINGNNNNGNVFYEHQNKVINTNIAQKERTTHIQEQQEFVQDKIRRKQQWEEELQRELEYQKQNPPLYLKY